MYNKRQELILDFIRDNPQSKREDIEKFLVQISAHVTKMTITRDLKKLLDDRAITKSGRAKATVYGPSTAVNLLHDVDVEAYFNQDQDKRQSTKVFFNFDIFSFLKNLLTDQEKNELYLINQAYVAKKAQLTPDLMHKEFERITVELAWKSSKIEGNTYTLLDTERLLKENVSARGRTKEETDMILNHKKALDFVLKDPRYYQRITVFKIKELHQLLVDKLGVKTGIRGASVGIIGTNYRPLDNVYQIKDALQQLVEIINETENPVEKALIAVLMISYIQPFEDGNKRTSRLLGNALLLANGYCPLSYRSVDEVEYKKAIILFYERNSVLYFKGMFIDQFKQAVENF